MAAIVCGAAAWLQREPRDGELGSGPVRESAKAYHRGHGAPADPSRPVRVCVRGVRLVLERHEGFAEVRRDPRGDARPDVGHQEPRDRPCNGNRPILGLLLRPRADQGRVGPDPSPLCVRPRRSVAVDFAHARSSYSRKRPKEDTVQYALLIYGSGEGWERLSEEEQQQQMKEYMALSQRPETRGGADLGELSSATT